MKYRQKLSLIFQVMSIFGKEMSHCFENTFRSALGVRTNCDTSSLKGESFIENLLFLKVQM